MGWVLDGGGCLMRIMSLYKGGGGSVERKDWSLTGRRNAYMGGDLST